MSKATSSRRIRGGVVDTVCERINWELSPTPITSTPVHPPETQGTVITSLPSASWVLERGRLANWQELWPSVITVPKDFKGLLWPWGQKSAPAITLISRHHTLGKILALVLQSVRSQGYSNRPLSDAKTTYQTPSQRKLVQRKPASKRRTDLHLIPGFSTTKWSSHEAKEVLPNLKHN